MGRRALHSGCAWYCRLSATLRPPRATQVSLDLGGIVCPSNRRATAFHCSVCRRAFFKRRSACRCRRPRTMATLASRVAILHIWDPACGDSKHHRRTDATLLTAHLAIDRMPRNRRAGNLPQLHPCRKVLPGRMRSGKPRNGQAHSHQPTPDLPRVVSRRFTTMFRFTAKLTIVK